MSIDPEDKHAKVIMEPVGFFVRCPSCKECMDISAWEHEDCSYDVDEANRFIECSECDKLIEIVGVRALVPLS